MYYKLKSETFAETEFVQINLNSEFSFLHLRWKQHPSSDQFRDGYNTGIDLALQFNIKYWLADARKIHYLAQADQSWLLSKMSPLIQSGQISKYVIIMESECFLMTQHKPDIISSQQQEEKPKANNFQIFVDEELAYSWLLGGLNISNAFLPF